MAQTVSDCLRIMRLATGRRNENDPDSTDTVFRRYLNNFINLTMSDDVKLFEQYGSLEFTISDTDDPLGVYTFNDIAGMSGYFTNISIEGFISLKDPVDESISWNRLKIYQDPGEFYGYWGVNNVDILIPGYPTEMLYYGDEFVFRTVPDTDYYVVIYGYKENAVFAAAGDPDLPFDYWLRYLSYGAALNYARDYRFDANALNQLKAEFAHERKLLLTRTHNQAKLSRAMPRF